MSSCFVLFHRPPPLLSPRVLTHFWWFTFFPQMIFSSAFMPQVSHLLCSFRSFPPVPWPPFPFQLFPSHTHKCGLWIQGGQSGICLSESTIVHVTMISISTSLPENDFTFILRLMKFYLHVSHILFISRYIDACIGCFHCLTVVSKAAVDLDVQESLWLRIFIPQNGTTGSYGRLCFMRDLQTDFHGGRFSWHSHQQCVRIPFFPRPGVDVTFVFWWTLL